MALILIADDDEMLCPLVEAALQAEGHEVVLAKEGREAVPRGSEGRGQTKPFEM